jgi:small subunit ribosomal protein S17
MAEELEQAETPAENDAPTDNNVETATVEANNATTEETEVAATEEHSVAPTEEEKAVAAKSVNSTEIVDNEPKRGNRAERVGIVSSDKMQKTVVVQVDRLVKHPIYRRYVRRKKKFMAHDEIGAKVGDKVRIMETRPLSARKRWRVIEIVQRAVK